MPRHRKTHEEFCEEVFDLVGNEYSILSTYEGVLKKVKIKHNCKKCNYFEFEIAPNHFLCHGTRCTKCSKIKRSEDKRSNIEEFKQKVFFLVKNEYTVLGKYKSARDKIKIKHNECNYIYDVSPDNFLHGNRCPNCKDSKGEKRIKEILNELNINFQWQFKKCKNPKTNYFLPYDFAIMDNDTPIAFIEYDGEQHFKEVKIFQNDGGLKGVKYRDKIKTEFAIKSRIPLIRIPYVRYDYLEYDIKSIVAALKLKHSAA